jgi:hypothetical protein
MLVYWPALAPVKRSLLSAFNKNDIEELLLFNFNIKLGNIVNVNDTWDSVFTSILFEAQKQNFIKELLERCRAERPYNMELSKAVENALSAIVGRDAAIPPLPQCADCWWRELSEFSTEEIASRLFVNLARVVSNAGIPLLTDELPSRMAQDTPTFVLGQKIVDTANQLIESMPEYAGRALITADFDSQNISNAWAKVLLSAEMAGSSTLLALLVAAFMQGGRLAQLSDANLRRLLN